MHILVREHLEGYLSGTLDAAAQQAVEAHLAACGECRDEWETMRQLAEELRTLRPPQHMERDLPAGFYARVVERIEAEREIPFWTMLLDPAFGRRLVFACLMLLALLGAYVAAFEKADYPSQHRPEAVLACQGPKCTPAPVRGPRLGPNLEHNRGVVLASLVADGD